MTWSIENLLRTLERMTRPPRLGHDVDGLDEPAAEAFPRGDAGSPLCCCDTGPEFICAPCGYEDHGECTRAADLLAEREAEEEVGEPRSCGMHTGRASNRCLLPAGHTGAHDVGPLTDEMRDEGWEFTAIPEPELSPDELVAVRQLIEERFPLPGPYTSPDSAWGNESSPADRLPAGDGGEAVTPPAASPHSPDLATWLEPAAHTILFEHNLFPDRDPELAPYEWTCSDSDGAVHDMFRDQEDWREHVVPILCAHIAKALPDYPDFPQ